MQLAEGAQLEDAPGQGQRLLRLHRPRRRIDQDARGPVDPPVELREERRHEGQKHGRAEILGGDSHVGLRGVGRRGEGLAPARAEVCLRLRVAVLLGDARRDVDGSTVRRGAQRRRATGHVAHLEIRQRQRDGRARVLVEIVELERPAGLAAHLAVVERGDALQGQLGQRRARRGLPRQLPTLQQVRHAHLGLRAGIQHLLVVRRGRDAHVGMRAVVASGDGEVDGNGQDIAARLPPRERGGRPHGGLLHRASPVDRRGQHALHVTRPEEGRQLGHARRAQKAR